MQETTYTAKGNLLTKSAKRSFKAARKRLDEAYTSLKQINYSAANRSNALNCAHVNAMEHVLKAIAEIDNFLD